MFEIVVLGMLAFLTWKTLAPSLRRKTRRAAAPQSGPSNVREVESSGAGLESAEEYARAQTWEDNSTIGLLATRGMVDVRVWRSHERLSWPMNIRRIAFDVRGEEVSKAYNTLVKTALTHPTCAGWPWILTYEEDNGPEPEAFYKLLTAIRHCPDCKEPLGNEQFCSKGHRGYDGVSGLYWTKARPSSPMAFGDPSKPRDFTTQNVWPYVPKVNPETELIEPADELDQVMEVNSIPMGFTLYRRSLFEQMEEPWFATLDPELTYDGQNRGTIGQDVFFCLKAKETVGARFGVHCGAKIAHYDTKTGKAW